VGKGWIRAKDIAFRSQKMVWRIRRRMDWFL
jgi:hypothetical protein